MHDPAAWPPGQQAPGHVQHRQGDVDSGDRIEVITQGAGEAPDPATEVKRPGPGPADPELIKPVQRGGDLGPSASHELADIPAPATPLWVNAHRPERIIQAEFRPVPRESGELAVR